MADPRQTVWRIRLRSQGVGCDALVCFDALDGRDVGQQRCDVLQAVDGETLETTKAVSVLWLAAQDVGDLRDGRLQERRGRAIAQLDNPGAGNRIVILSDANRTGQDGREHNEESDNRMHGV